MKQDSTAPRITGFTIVELLIVIVVIGILAAITIVAYTGVNQRAAYATMKSDFAVIQKALEMYKEANDGKYPDSANCVNRAGQTNYEHEWCGYDQGTGDSFIPGLSPEFISSVPNLPDHFDRRNTYLYKSANYHDYDRGTLQYQLIRYNPSGLTKVEIANAPLLSGAYMDGPNGPMAWGIKSNPDSNWW